MVRHVGVLLAVLLLLPAGCCCRRCCCTPCCTPWCTPCCTPCCDGMSFYPPRPLAPVETAPPPLPLPSSGR